MFCITYGIISFLQTTTKPLLCFYILSWGMNCPIIHRISQRCLKGIMCKRRKLWENTFWHLCITDSKILKMKNLAAFLLHTGKMYFVSVYGDTPLLFCSMEQKHFSSTGHQHQIDLWEMYIVQVPDSEDETTLVTDFLNMLRSPLFHL